MTVPASLPTAPTAQAAQTTSRLPLPDVQLAPSVPSHPYGPNPPAIAAGDL